MQQEVINDGCKKEIVVLFIMYKETHTEEAHITHQSMAMEVEDEGHTLQGILSVRMKFCHCRVQDLGPLEKDS